ncbi:MAG: hypothetical protein QM820_38050 [Minicystis sp.]
MNEKIAATVVLLSGLLLGACAMGPSDQASGGDVDEGALAVREAPAAARVEATSTAPAAADDDEERIVEGRRVDPHAAPAPVRASRIPEALRAGVARATAHLQGIRHPGISFERDLRMRRAGRHENGTTRAVFQQYHRGIPVFGGLAVVETDASGRVTEVQDALVEGLSVETSPRLTEQEAAAVALKIVSCAACRADALPASLWVMRHEGAERLVYSVQVPEGGVVTREALRSVFVDAQSGEVVWSCARSDHALCLAHP